MSVNVYFQSSHGLLLALASDGVLMEFHGGHAIQAKVHHKLLNVWNVGLELIFAYFKSVKFFTHEFADLSN